MKKRKREKLNHQKEAKQKEWEKVRSLQEKERGEILRQKELQRTMDIINAHFGFEAFERVKEDDSFVLDVDKTILKLSCDTCYHYNRKCKGKGLEGEGVMKCLRGPEHEECDVDGIDDEDDEEDYEE